VSPSERYALVPDENASSVHVCLIQLQNKLQPKHLTELLFVFCSSSIVIILTVIFICRFLKQAKARHAATELT
jgi:Na+/H+ antiporter NhaC